MRLKADLTLLAVSVIWGSAFVAQRVAGQLGSVYYFNGARYLLAALVVLPFVPRIKFLNTKDTKDTKVLRSSLVTFVPFVVKSFSYPYEQYKWMFVAGLLLFIGSALQQAGMVYTSAGNAGFITSLYVVFIPFALLIFWKEKPHWMSIVAVGVAGTGAFLLSTGGKFEVKAGDVLEIFGALFWTFHVIVLGKFVSKFEAMSFSVGQLFVCGIFNLGFGVFVESPMPFDWSLIGAIAYTAFFSLGLCYTLQVWAQRHSPPADAALILSLESVFAVLSGWLLLNEKLIAIQILGCVLIFAAVVLSQLKEWTSGKIDHDHLVEGR